MGIQEIQYFRRNFENLLLQNTQHNESPSLSPILEKKIKKETSRLFNISKNSSNEYAIDLQSLCALGCSELVFVDNEQKVFEILYIDHEMSIHVFCEETVNFLGDIKTHRLEIESKGAVIFGGRILVGDIISIKASKLDFKASVKCQKSLFFCKNSLVIHDNFRAKKIEWIAGIIIQNRVCNASVSQISCKEYYQNEQSSLTVNQMIFIADYLQSYGNLIVSESLFMACHGLLLGGKQEKTLWKISSLNHLHFSNVDFSNNSHIEITPFSNHVGKLIIDGSLYISMNSVFKLNQSLFNSSIIEIYGEFFINHSSVAFKKMNQLGHLNLLNSEFYIDEYFYQDDIAKTTIANSFINCEDLIIKSGDFICQNKSQLYIKSQFSTDESSIIYLERSKMLVEDTAIIAGKLKLKHSQFNSNKLKSYQDINLQHSILTVAYSYIFGKSCFEYSTLITEYLEILDEASISQSDFLSQTIFLLLTKSNISESTFKANKIAIVASHNLIEFNKSSYLVANHFHIENDVLFHQSTLVGIDTESTQHAFIGSVILDASAFYTQSKIVHTSSLNLIHGSVLLSHELDSMDTLSCQNSFIEVKSLRNSSSLSSHCSVVNIQEEILGSQEIFLNDCSRLTSKRILLKSQQRLKLQKNSQLFSLEDIILEPGSQLNSNESIIATKKMLVKGHMDIINGLVDVEEITIFKQFSAKQSSMLKVHGEMRLEEGSEAILEDSFAQAKNCISSGNIVLRDANLDAEEDLNLTKQSQTFLVGKSDLSANNIKSAGKIFINASLTKHKNILPSISAKNKNVLPSIKAKNNLDISLDTEILGDYLSIESNNLVNKGNIHLNKYLSSTGKWFCNRGDIYAKEAKHGFDYLSFNLGTLSAEKMEINTNIINFFGGIYATKSLSSSGIFNLNMGLVSANNYYNNALISFSAGVIAPNLNAEWSDIISIQNLTGLLINNINMLAPSYAQGVGLIPTIISLTLGAMRLRKDFNELTWDNIKSMSIHDWYPIVGKMKNYFSIAQSAYSNFSGLSAEAHHWTEAYNTCRYKPKNILTNVKKSFQDADWGQMGLSSAGLFFGTYSDNSFVHMNAGISLMPNTTQWNFIDYNVGIEQSLFSHSKMTNYFLNEGYSGGTQAAFMFKEMKNKGELDGHYKLLLKGHQAENIRSIKGSNGIVDVENLKQKGLLDLNKSFLKIKQFEDALTATTRLNDSAIQGKTLNQHGQFDFTKVTVKESEYYHGDANAQSNFDSVYIETKDFNYNGSINYKNNCTVVADEIYFGEESRIKGAKTDKDKLFKDKPKSSDKDTASDNKDTASDNKDTASDNKDTASDNKDTASDNKDTAKEPEKEFCPQHILNLRGNKISIKHQMSGGDYTQISGKPSGKSDDPDISCDDLNIGDSADIDLEYGSIHAKNMQTYGKAHFEHFNFKVNHHHVYDQAHFDFTNGYYEGDFLENRGHFSAKDSYFKISNVHFEKTATEIINNTYFDCSKIVDESHLYTSGQVVFSTEDYHHTGDIQNDKNADPNKKNLFYVKSKTATLDGRCHLDNVFYDIESFADAKALATGSGKYSLYFASESFGLSTTGTLDINQEISRNCNLYLQADSINMTHAYKKQYDLSLVSRVGDVNLLADVSANNFYVQSAGKIITNKNLAATNTLAFSAKGSFVNYGGIVTGKTTSIEASEIKNITAASAAAQHGTPSPMGNSGIINATERLYLSATQGNIENHGGIIRAGIYAQLLAKGDVLNLCNTRTYQGKYDVVKEFDPGLIQGGTGEGEDKIGLYIKANGKVIGDASDFISNGTNYIQGVKGIDLGYRSHTYISNYQDEHGPLSFTHKIIIDTHTNLKGCAIQSTNGRNILISDEGGVTTQAANFISPGGTDIYAKKDVVLQSAIYSDKHYVYRGKCWDLFNDVKNDILQQSTPTLFLDNGVTRIKSVEGCVDARGAYFIGAGDLSIEAHKKILIGRDVLDQQRDTSSRSVNWSAPGLAGAKSLINGQGAWTALTAEDATLAKLNSLMGSQSVAELLANASNLGVDLTNTTNSACRAIGTNNLVSELFSRYGLGGAKGFNPIFSIGVTQSHASMQAQTLGKGGIERGGNVSLKSDTGIEVFNGAPVHAGKNLNLDAPEFIAHAAKLNSEYKKNTEGFSFHMNMINGVQSATATASTSQQNATQYAYADICSGGTTYIHHGDGAMSHLELDGAKINSKNIQGSVDKLVIIDKQDARQASSKSASVGTSGDFSFYASKSKEQVTTQHSGIHTTDDLNTTEHHFEVNNTVMIGGEITSDGVNYFQTKTLESHSLNDTKEQIGIGYSGRLSDFEEHPTPTNRVGEKVFDNLGHIKVDFEDYKATQHSVLYGAAGNDLNIQEFYGDTVHTSSSNGKEVHVNMQEHIKYDIPVTDMEHIKIFADNRKSFFDKINPPKPQTVDEAVLPNSRRKEDKHHGVPAQSAGPHPYDPKKLVEKAMKNIHIDPKLASKAHQELEKYGKLSAQTENLLKNKIVEALVKTVKAGTDYGWGKLSDLVLKDMFNRTENLINHIQLGTKGAILQFQFNLLLADNEKASDKFKHAAAQTGTDMVVALLLSKTPGVGWVLTVADVMDSFYDKDKVQQFLELNGDINQQAIQAIQEGHYLKGIGLADQSRVLLSAAGTMELIHQLANITQPIVNKIDEMLGVETEQNKKLKAAGI